MISSSVNLSSIFIKMLISCLTTKRSLLMKSFLGKKCIKLFGIKALRGARWLLSKDFSAPPGPLPTHSAVGGKSVSSESQDGLGSSARGAATSCKWGAEGHYLACM